MSTLGELAKNIRSKNAGPYWVTIDVFCGDGDRYDTVSRRLSTAAVAALYGQPAEAVRRFDMPALHAIKFSLPRPVPQGSRFDRDMHGAQWSVLLAELELET